jgi:hypothetical protein
MGLEPMTSPLPRECSTTELHQPSCSNFLASSRARIFASTTRKPNIPRTKIGSHRISMSRSSNPTYRFEKPCTWTTADASIVNHDSTPKTTKTPSATYIRRLSAAGSSDRSLSPITIAPESLPTYYLLFTLYYLLLAKNGAQGRIRTFVAHNAADLQSAAINHSATCALLPARTLSRNPSTIPASARTKPDLPRRLNGERCKGNIWQVQPTLVLPQKNLELAKGFEPPTA